MLLAGCVSYKQQKFDLSNHRIVRQVGVGIKRIVEPGLVLANLNHVTSKQGHPERKDRNSCPSAISTLSWGL